MAVLTPAGVYAPGRKPPKAEIIQLLEQIMGSASAPAVVRQTKTALDLVTPASETYGGLVLNDPDPTKNGYYYRSSSTWVKGRGFPDTFAQATFAGTGTAQTMNFEPGVDPADVLVYFGTVSVDNTGPLTLDGTDVVNAAGNALSAGEWTGTVLFFVNGDGDYQLLFDAGAVASAAQSASEAADSAAEAAGYAAGLNIAPILPGDAGKLLAVNGDEDGSEWVDPLPFVGDAGSGGVKGLVPAPAAGDAAAGKVLGAGGGWVVAATAISPGGRLTLVSATPIMPQTTDYSSATLYYPPYKSSIIPIFDGSAWTFPRFTSGPTDQVGLSMAGGAKWTANGKRDVFVINDGGTLRLATSAVVWPGDSEASRGLVRRDGIWVNSASVTLDISAAADVVVAENCATWVGSIEPASSATLTAKFTQGQNPRCDVWNVYHQRPIVLTVGQPPVSGSVVLWKPDTQSTTYKAFNDDPNNKGRYFTGLPQNISVEWYQRGFVDSLNFTYTGGFWSICKDDISTKVGSWGSFSSDTADDAFGFVGTATFEDRGSVGSHEAIMGTAKVGAVGTTLFGMYPQPSAIPPDAAQAVYIRYMG